MANEPEGHGSTAGSGAPDGPPARQAGPGARASISPSRRDGHSHGLAVRLRPLIMTALAAWIIFTGFRVGLLISSSSNLSHPLDPRDVLTCVARGLRYDALPIGYGLLPMAVALLLAGPARLGRRSFQKGVAIYAAAGLGVVVLAEIIGAGFFLHFNSRLNWIAVSYPQHWREVAGYIWFNYPIIVAVVVIAMLGYGLYRAAWRAFWPAEVPAGAGGGPWARGVALVVAVVLCGLAARGSLGPHPLRFGPAHFSNNNIVNQLTMNNFFTFFYAVRSSIDHPAAWPRPLYPFPAENSAHGVAMEMLLLPGDTPLGSPQNPLWRRMDTGRPMQPLNVVMIIMESQAGPAVGALGHHPSFTPELDALCRDGLFFDRMYAVGARTSRGIVGLLCGHPDLEGSSLLKQEAAIGQFLTLPSLFADLGYHTSFIYGGDAEFDNMRQFLLAGGVREVLGQESMPPGKLTGTWGATDEVVLQRAHERFVQMGDRPFFSVVLTLSNHEPYRIPDGRVEIVPGNDLHVRRLNAARYADWAIGEFFRQARQAEYFHRTIFVLVADHGQGLDPTPMLDVPGFRVPCVFYAPGIIPGATRSTVASQIDVAPTLLGLLGGSWDHCFMGRDLQAVDEEDGFAVMHDRGALAIVRGDRAVVLAPDTPRASMFDLSIFSLSPRDAEGADGQALHRLQHEMLCYYRTAQDLYRGRAYRRPDDLPGQQ